ncbi:hypothetical protein X975_02856, partial [Stegodyphus mimosarum]
MEFCLQCAKWRSGRPFSPLVQTVECRPGSHDLESDIRFPALQVRPRRIRSITTFTFTTCIFLFPESTESNR